MDTQTFADVYLEAMEENQREIPQAENTGSQGAEGLGMGEHKKRQLGNCPKPNNANNAY